MILSTWLSWKGVRVCFLCPFCAPLFRCRSLFLEGLTMSEEGGWEELPECFLRMAISASSWAIFSSAALSSLSSSAIRLSLASLTTKNTLFDLPVEKRNVNAYDEGSIKNLC